MITAAEVETQLNPEGASTKFQSAAVSAAVDRAILNGIAIVQAHLPEEYRRFQTVIPGLIITRDAVEDATEYTIPSWISYQSGTLWRNLDRPWYSRRLTDAEEFTFDANTNTLTLEDPAVEGDTFVMEIVHNSDYPEILKSLALKVVVFELLENMPRLVSSEDFERYSQNMQNTLGILRDMRRGMVRINVWDDLDLLAENETITPQGKGYLNPNGW